MSKRPNIVIFNPDQWRGDVLGHLGNPAALTPNLDSLIQSDGVSFANTYCQNPVCTPSRCSFMTGWYPHVRGHRTMFHMLRKEDPNLLKNLKNSGYQVWWGGKNDLLPGQDGWSESCDIHYRPSMPPERTWMIDKVDEWRGSPDSATYYSFFVGKMPQTDGFNFYYDSDWANVLGAVEYIKNAPEDKPFCLYLPLTYPHPPYAVEDPWHSMIDRGRMPPRIPAPETWTGKPGILKGIWERQDLQSFDEEWWTELRAVYYGMCSRVDYQFGMILNALKEKGNYDDTAVFFFSDHGDFTGDYGIVEKTQNTFEDCLTRVPFLIKPPSWIDIKPRVSDALVELIDFPATVEEMTGIEPQHTHFGKSLAPLIAGETDEHRDAVFCEGGRIKGEKHCSELMPNGLPFPSESFYWPRISLQNSEGPEHTKAAMCRTREFKYVKRLYERDELYDLVKDPGETKNVIGDPTYSKELSKLKDRLAQWYMETCDCVPIKYDERDFGS